MAKPRSRRSRTHRFIRQHSLSIASASILALWICLYSGSSPGTHLGSFFGNAIADWSGVVVMVFASKYLYEKGSAESRRPPRTLLGPVWERLRDHSLSIFLVITSLTDHSRRVPAIAVTVLPERPTRAPASGGWIPSRSRITRSSSALHGCQSGQAARMDHPSCAPSPGTSQYSHSTHADPAAAWLATPRTRHTTVAGSRMMSPPQRGLPAHGHPRQHLVDEIGGAFGHPPPPAARAKAASLAGEGHGE
jgi:hypothetical protein